VYVAFNTSLGVMASLTSEGKTAGTLCESVDLDSGMNLTLDAGIYKIAVLL